MGLIPGNSGTANVHTISSPYEFIKLKKIPKRVFHEFMTLQYRS